MKANKTIPQAVRESTPVERILDLRESASSVKQESGLAQVCAGLERHGGCFWDGDIWSLVDAIQEHEDLKRRFSKLKEHGIDLDDGTLSIKLWEE